MNIQKKRLGPGIPVLELIGSITAGAECEQLAREVEHLVQQNETRVVLDLSALQHIDSAGLGRIVACLARLRKAGGDLRLAGAQGMVANILKMTHVEEALGAHPTAAAAADSFTPTNPHNVTPAG